MIPRGVRNNNPGNIRHSQVHWEGEALTQPDPDFVQFMDPEHGIRAIVRILRSYKRNGLDTIRKAVNRWAPPNENNTDAYVSAVCEKCGVGPDDSVDYDTIMTILVKAIIQHENGTQPYGDDIISVGIALA